MEVSNEVRVKDEPIYDSQSISDSRKATLSSNKLNKKTNNEQAIKEENISSFNQPNKSKRQSISTMKVKEEPIDIEMQISSKSHIQSTSEEVEIKSEEQFSVTEEFTNKTSIAFLNEQSSTSSNDDNVIKEYVKDNVIPRNKKSKFPRDKSLYKCDTCKKNFNRSTSLKLHQRIHSGERPFKCDVCIKSFSQAFNLKIHQRSHNGERPFVCDICQKRFIQSSALKSHRRTHTGEKPYECEICQKRFIRSDELETHKRIHSGERPYECAICQKRFTTSSSLLRHRRTQHGK